jgi:hypothetical protein
MIIKCVANRKNVKYILVYEMKGYAEEGGGTYAEYFETIEEMTEFVNKKIVNHEKDFTISFACSIDREIEYKPVEIIKRFEPSPKEY